MALASRTPKASAKTRGFQRWQALQRLGFEDYAAYLRSPEWAAVKRRYFASDQPQSCICGETQGLQLHHLTYERVGQEDLADLRPLCGNCHNVAHVLERRGDVGLDLDGLYDADRAERHREAERERHAAEAHKLAVLSTLPLHQRLLLLTERDDRDYVNISSGLRVVERQIARMEQKVSRP